MRRRPFQHAGSRRGASNSLYFLAFCSLLAFAGLALLLLMGSDRPVPEEVVPRDARPGTHAGQADASDDAELFVYCAAGMRYAMEEVAARYRKEYGVRVQLQYGGSNTLLNQIEVSRTGDLYLAADQGYTDLASQKGLIHERFPLAQQRPVLLVQAGNPKKIQNVSDLLRADVTVALADPDAAAIGKKTRRLLSASGVWTDLRNHATVIKPTVNDVANSVKLGSVDAGIVWDSIASQYPQLVALHDSQLDLGPATIELAVLAETKQPRAALRFARYVAARDKGLQVFAAMGIPPVDGDLWTETPQLTFFAGSINRRALEPIIREFEQREGVRVDTVYNGCGILTGQMRTLHDKGGRGFPDTFMACDVYYLDTVKDWFQDAVNVSDTDVVMVVPKGNPKNIRTLEDLARPGMRVAIGQPDQCTIGVLSRRLLQDAGLFQRLFDQGNIVTQTATSALLVPNITTGAADVVLAYRTDTEAERDRLGVLGIASPLARAIQPFSIARSSDHKYLARRLFLRITESRDRFESAGFRWRLDDTSAGDPSRSGSRRSPVLQASP